MKLWNPAVVLALLAGAPVYAAEVVVSQKDKQFSTESLTIKAGDTVVFQNDDDTSHNVFSSTEGNKFNLGIQKKDGDTKKVTHTFDAPGEVEIRCAIHPKMKLNIKIEPR